MRRVLGLFKKSHRLTKRDLNQLEERLKMKLTEVVAQLREVRAGQTAVVDQVSKAQEEIVTAIAAQAAKIKELEEAIANEEAPEELTAIVEELKAGNESIKTSTQALDDLHPDAPPAPPVEPLPPGDTPVTESTRATRNQGGR